MTRLCGASAQRDSSGQRRCWCLGLFCGPGGTKMTRQFRIEYQRPGVVIRDLYEFKQVASQWSLFDQNRFQAGWLARLDTRRGGRSWSAAKELSQHG